MNNEDLDFIWKTWNAHLSDEPVGGAPRSHTVVRCAHCTPGYHPLNTTLDKEFCDYCNGKGYTIEVQEIKHLKDHVLQGKGMRLSDNR